MIDSAVVEYDVDSVNTSPSAEVNRLTNAGFLPSAAASPRGLLALAGRLRSARLRIAAIAVPSRERLFRLVRPAVLDCLSDSEAPLRVSPVVLDCQHKSVSDGRVDCSRSNCLVDAV